MVVVPMTGRTDDGVSIRNRGQLRQMLTNGNSADPGGYRLEFAANLDRRLRLQVERVQVRRPAIVVDQDTGLGLAEAATGRWTCHRQRSRRRLAAQPVGPHQPWKG